MKPRYTMEWSITDLPLSARNILANGYCIDDDDNHLKIGIIGIIDGVVDGRFAGVEFPIPGVVRKLSLLDIPRSWWKFMAFPPKMEKDMKAFWRKNPTGSVEWRW